MSRLTLKQRAFIEHFLGDPEVQWNATGAARKAGYKCPNVSGAQNLAKPRIQQYIAARLREMGASTEMLIGRWLARIEVDISPFVDKDGLDVEKLKLAGFGFLIKGARKTKDVTNILLRDPDKAEEMLARALGMFIERRKHSGSVELVSSSVLVYLPDNQRGDVLETP